MESDAAVSRSVHEPAAQVQTRRFENRYAAADAESNHDPKP